jgi:hypothetical protein
MEIEELKKTLKEKCPNEWALIERLIELSHELGVRDGDKVKMPKFDDNDEWIKEGKWHEHRYKGNEP